MGRGGRRGHLLYPLKRLKKLDHKIAIKVTKHENRVPPHNPKYPPQKNLKMTLHL
jgi:hypothetical protein